MKLRHQFLEDNFFLSLVYNVLISILGLRMPKFVTNKLKNTYKKIRTF